MQKYGIVNTDGLHLRSAPSTSAQILAELSRGTLLQILKDSGFDWLQVQVDTSGTQGYVSKVYLVLTDTKPSASPQSTPASAPTPAPVAAPTPAPTATPTPQATQPTSPAAPPTSTQSTPAPVPTPTPVAAPTPIPAPTPAATPVDLPFGAIGKGEVTTNSLNIRSGPGTNFDIVTTAAQGTVLAVLANQGSWIKVHFGGADGYVAAQFLDLTTTKPLTMFLIERTDLLATKLEPDTRIPDQTPNTPEALVARVWNSYGGLLGKLSMMLNCPADGIVAVLTAESGGNGFGPDGRLKIRLEAHLLWDRWGKDHADQFNQFFQFDQSAPANAWKGHKFRPDANSPWQFYHDNQDLEWKALTIARALDDTAALSSISMGAPQIMGFNFRRLGYSSVQAMFNQFAHSISAQLLALFDFVRGTSDNSPAIQALRSQDYLTFAKIYNGPANAPTYQNIITSYSGVYDHLIGTVM